MYTWEKIQANEFARFLLPVMLLLLLEVELLDMLTVKELVQFLMHLLESLSMILVMLS